MTYLSDSDSDDYYLGFGDGTYGTSWNLQANRNGSWISHTYAHGGTYTAALYRYIDNAGACAPDDPCVLVPSSTITITVSI